MNLLPTQRLLASFSIALLFVFLPSGSVLSQTPEASGGGFMEEIITLGVRSSGRVAARSPVPVDAFTSEDLKNTGASEVGRMLQALAPSFNFSSSAISDGTDALRPATLRGLGPDQTLVLVNGKRRHGTALVHVNTAVGRGATGTDLNAIPGIALERIEILRDGASAQYGSDAIAGVINLVLKDGADGGEASVHLGEYTEGDGATTVVDFQYGGSLGRGTWNVALEYRDREATNRAGLSGECQYTCSKVTIDGVEVLQTTDQREIDFDRLNFRLGDADSEHLSGVLNLDIPFGAGDNSFYLFATYSNRDNGAPGFYRRVSQPDRNPTYDIKGDPVNLVNGESEAYIEGGFLPLIETSIADYSLDLGVNGSLGSWQWDWSLGRGSNAFGFEVSNSLNASQVRNPGGATPVRSADAGELALGLWSMDLNFFKETSWGSLALGAAYRIDEWQLNAGEEVSYRDYDTDENEMPIGIDVPTNRNAIGGIQVFPGFQPGNEVDEDRSSTSVYVDAEWQLSDALLVTGAARYEKYSDFGDTLNVKGAFVVDVSSSFRVRGAISTGFRAPSLQQQYFNNLSTQFSPPPGDPDGPLIGVQVGTFRNDSALAKGLGIPEIKEETSRNYSIGLVWQPISQFTLTADVYKIDIEDRIVISGKLVKGEGLGAVLDEQLTLAGAGSAQFFFNGADTETTGLDVVANYNTQLAGGYLGLSLGLNITETQVSSTNAPASLSSVDIDTLFTPQDISIIEEWQPEQRISLVADYQRGGWTFAAGLQRYGEYTVLDSGKSQTFGAKHLVDTSLTYAFNNGFYLTFGGNNVFDEVPDENEVGQARTGTIVDADGNVVVSSPGVFRYSRRSVPFGVNGAYWYGSAGIKF